MAGPKISVKVDDRKLRALIKGTKGTVKPRIVADGVEYGLFVHQGTTRMAARPFMRQAVEAVRPGFAKAFDEQLTVKQIESVLNKTARDVERGAKQRAPVDTDALRSSIHVIKGETQQDTSPAGKVV